MINVLLNAVEVLPEGGHIEIATKQLRMDGGAIHVEITDDGPGISAEDFPYIFDPFFSNKKKGTGLGLSNVKKIIEAHGGTGTVAPRKPHGTRVSLTIPFQGENMKAKRILIIDDERPLLETLEMFLTEKGYAWGVRCPHRGFEAMRRF